MEDTLFGGAEPPRQVAGKARVMITVKAAPNPSAQYGETVCVAGVRIADDGGLSWIRLYPINFRALDRAHEFRKYDVIRLAVTPVGGDGGDNRIESHRPDVGSVEVDKHLDGWPDRAPWLEPLVSADACRLALDARARTDAPSLALIRPREVLDLDIESHPGWSPDEQRKIDTYVNQLTLFDDGNRRPLEAPRFKGWYRYRCHATACPGHRQQLLDWEFVVLQRRHAHDSDTATREALRARFLEMMCAPTRDPAFFLGNQAKRRFVFSTLGTYYPSRP